MEMGPNPISSARYLRLFSQMNQQSASQQEDLSQFQHMLLQLRAGSVADIHGEQTKAGSGLAAVSFADLDADAQWEGDALLSLSVMDPNRIQQAIQQALSDPLEGTDHSLQTLHQRLVSLKQSVSEPSSQSQQPQGFESPKPATGTNASGLAQSALVDQSLLAVNPSSTALASESASANDFFYRFAALPGTITSELSRAGSALGSIDARQGLGSGDLTLTAVATKAVVARELDSLPMINAQNAKEQGAFLESEDSGFKSAAYETRSMLVESATDASGRESVDVGSDSKRESGLEMAMKLKLQDPNLRAQLSGKLADRIQMMIHQGVQQARIQLDPPELGMLEVRLQFQHDQVQINILSQSPQVRDALEGHSVRLREMLEQQGIQLAGLDVQDQSERGAGYFSEQNQREQEQRDQSNIWQQQRSDAATQDVNAQASAMSVVSATLSLDLFV